jgi:pSer/pThr/pTyr-binding forkhead associated (FHA) protein
MLELQVPLLAAKALLLLLLFAFIYAVMRRGIGDLRRVPDDEPFEPGRAQDRRGAYAPRSLAPGESELVVEDSEILAPQTRFAVRDGETSLGRSAASDIVLKNDDFASGRHAQLTRHGGLLYVEDLGSTNGTYLDQQRVQGPLLVNPGQPIRIGQTALELRT